MNQVIGKRKKIQDFKIFIMYMIIPAASLFVMIIVFYSGAVHYMAGYASAFLGCSFAVLFLGNVKSSMHSNGIRSDYMKRWNKIS